MASLGERQSRVIGVCFHGVGPPPLYLGQWTQRIFLDEKAFLSILDEVREHPEVELSFDDGYSSDLDIVLPALIERGLKATFFPLAGRLGCRGYVDPEGLRALTTSGMTVGSHGMHHRSWRGLDSQEQQEEFVAARSIIAEAAAAEVTQAACPNGSYDRQVLKYLRTRGYVKVFTSDSRVARRGAWLQPRFVLFRDDTVSTFRENVLSPRPLGDRARQFVVCKIKAAR